MIKLFPFLFIILSLCATVGAEDICSKVDSGMISNHVPIHGYDILSKKNVKGLCEVIISIGGRMATLYVGNDFVISGSMYSDRAVLNEQTLQSLKSVEFNKYRAALDKLKVFEYKPKDAGDRFLYMFTDPLCPHCHHAEGLVKKFADEHKISIKYILVAVNGKKSKEKIVEALCREFQINEYEDSTWRKKNSEEKYQCRRGKDRFVQSDVLSEKLMINAVPSFYTDSGVSINGFDILQLEKNFESISVK